MYFLYASTAIEFKLVIGAVTACKELRVLACQVGGEESKEQVQPHFQDIPKLCPNASIQN